MDQHRVSGEVRAGGSGAVMVAVEARDRLCAFAEDVASVMALGRQRQNAELYVRGLIEQGGRKSLQPTLFRFGETPARYESMQQFLTDSPWPAGELVRACAERVGPQLEVVAWVVDHTSFPKTGKLSPGVKRQYCGALGKISNCQVGVSLHACGRRGTLPIGWALYLPEEWCADAERRRRAKIPDEVAFRRTPELASELIDEAVGWQLQAAPILADQAYGDDAGFRNRLSDARLAYVLAIREETSVFAPDTTFAVRARRGAIGRRPSFAYPDQPACSVAALALELPAGSWRSVRCRTTPVGEHQMSRFAFVRVWAAHPILRDRRPPQAEWLIIEWPPEADAPSDYWLSNLPAGTSFEELARLARLRWTIELDYRQLKGELGLDHYEGRSFAGWHHHCALVSCAHAFLTEERLHPKALRPA
jgi:SRSO17 transposase